MVDAVCFDFDGVILESVDVKTRAFAAMFECHGTEIRDRVVEYHLLHGGVSRFAKIMHFYNEFLGLPITEDELQRQCAVFSGLVLDKVMCAPFVPGALEFLETAGSGYRMFVVSGTPEDELRRIVEARGLSRFFEGVYGAPGKKAGILSEIMTRCGFDPARVAFVGDAMTDHDAARACGVRFIGRVPPGEESPFPDADAVLVDLTGLTHALTGR